MLLIVFAMYVPVRGMFCGYCKRGLKCGKMTPKCCEKSDGSYWMEMATFLRKYHGYYIAFAVTNDWYYHPLEATPGHLTGIMIDLLIFWQLITIYTPTHRNKWWCICCEFAVILHAPLISLQLDKGSRRADAGMFGFGLTILFLLTGQWGLPI